MSDWKETCTKCMEGDIEPRHCEYYGEPNGCNSPSYGQHPTTDKSSAVGNAAAMREALVAIRKALFRDSGMGPTTAFHAEVDRLTSTALSAPPRNCDVYKTSWDVVTHWDGGLDSAKSVGRMLDWLLAQAKAERKGECDGR